MRCFFDPRQLAHAPAQELHNGGFVPYAETPARAGAVLAAVGPAEPAVDHGEAPLRAVHDEAYLAFLWSAHKDWRAAGRAGDASGYAWPVVRRRPLALDRIDARLGAYSFDGPLALDRIDARLGAYSFDASSPIAAGTWEGAYWSAQTALTALDAVLAGEQAAFALCRPPGHHAGRDYLGGYCHLNNAAIAAEAATAAGRRVATSTSTIITATAPRTFSTTAAMSCSRPSMPIRGPTIPISGAMPMKSAMAPGRARP
jgi:acetoin utilization deacetylase AcuC-like enzyme